MLDQLPTLEDLMAKPTRVLAYIKKHAFLSIRKQSIDPQYGGQLYIKWWDECAGDGRVIRSRADAKYYNKYYIEPEQLCTLVRELTEHYACPWYKYTTVDPNDDCACCCCFRPRPVQVNGTDEHLRDPTHEIWTRTENRRVIVNYWLDVSKSRLIVPAGKVEDVAFPEHHTATCAVEAGQSETYPLYMQYHQ